LYCIHICITHCANKDITSTISDDDCSTRHKPPIAAVVTAVWPKLVQMQLKILQTNTSFFSKLIFITQRQIIIVCHLFYMLLKYTTCQKLDYGLGDCIQYAIAKTLKLYHKDNTAVTFEHLPVTRKHC